jgi:hypothetical protein
MHQTSSFLATKTTELFSHSRLLLCSLDLVAAAQPDACMLRACRAKPTVVNRSHPCTTSLPISRSCASRISCLGRSSRTLMSRFLFCPAFGASSPLFSLPLTRVHVLLLLIRTSRVLLSSWTLMMKNPRGHSRSTRHLSAEQLPRSHPVAKY